MRAISAFLQRRKHGAVPNNREWERLVRILNAMNKADMAAQEFSAERRAEIEGALKDLGYTSHHCRSLDGGFHRGHLRIGALEVDFIYGRELYVHHFNERPQRGEQYPLRKYNHRFYVVDNGESIVVSGRDGPWWEALREWFPTGEKVSEVTRRIAEWKRIDAALAAAHREAEDRTRIERAKQLFD